MLILLLILLLVLLTMVLWSSLVLIRPMLLRVASYSLAVLGVECGLGVLRQTITASCHVPRQYRGDILLMLLSLLMLVLLPLTRCQQR